MADIKEAPSVAFPPKRFLAVQYSAGSDSIVSDTALNRFQLFVGHSAESISVISEYLNVNFTLIENKKWAGVLMLLIEKKSIIKSFFY